MRERTAESMEHIKKNGLRILIISIACGTLDFVLQGATASLHVNNLNTIEPSMFVRIGLIYPLLIAYYWADYLIMAIIFVWIEQGLPGNRWLEGLTYGLCIGGLYLIGMYEGILILNDTVINATWVGLCDGLPIVFMGVLAGIFTGTPGVQGRYRRRLYQVPIISMLYVGGRYFSYGVLHIHSAYVAMPLGTFVWTLCQGAWIGVLYVLLRPGIKRVAPITKALFFGTVIFGLNWLMYHFFIPMMFETSIADILIRVGVDSLSVTIGAYICERRAHTA